jgi:DNA-binding CsgD family transcriptional regulator
MHYTAARIARRGLDVAALGQVKRTATGILSDRERQVLIQSASGKTTLEIGQALQISERTAVFHLSNVRRKLGASNSRHAVSKAFSLKLIGAG